MEFDIQKLTSSERQLVLDAALQTRDMDNLLLLSKVQQRFSRCGRLQAQSSDGHIGLPQLACLRLGSCQLQMTVIDWLDTVPTTTCLSPQSRLPTDLTSAVSLKAGEPCCCHLHNLKVYRCAPTKSLDMAGSDSCPRRMRCVLRT